MAQTRYGLIETKILQGRGEVIFSTTFRLHLGHGVTEDDIFFPLTSAGESGRTITINDVRTMIRADARTSAGMIYERELHVSKAKGWKGEDVLHLKEGSRFTEVGLGETFPQILMNFLQAKVC
jgi:hypothetical protein